MKKMIFPLTLIFLLAGCTHASFFSGGGVSLPTQKLSLFSGGREIKLTVEVADTREEREKGLMERDELDSDAGMLFIFPDEAPRNFWMKNTLIPLDILFFSKDKKIVGMIEDMVPCPENEEHCPVYASDVAAMYALEVPVGFVKEKGVRVGDELL